MTQLINSFTHLKRPKSEIAQALLKRIAAHCEPIMRNRKWRVGVLAEFYPARAELLGQNTNRGQRIDLRLRESYNDGEFLPFEALMETMLHELTHNECGSHDAKFYALLDDLQIEYFALISKGFKGDDGDVVGGRRLTLAQAKQAGQVRALRAARGTSKDGCKLGGISSVTKTPKELVREAAERRTFDAKWCGQGLPLNPVCIEDEVETCNNSYTSFVSSVPITVCEEKVANKVLPVIEISSDEDDNGTKLESDVALSDHERMKKRGLLDDSLYEHLQKLKRTKMGREKSLYPANSWTCEKCTYINELTDALCDMCRAERPSGAGQSASHWLCTRCRQLTERNFWSCQTCGKIKETS